MIHTRTLLQSLCLTLLLLTGSLHTRAQASASPSRKTEAAPDATGKESSFSLGIGRSRQLDTYLSPIAYTGPQLTLLQEIHRTRPHNRHVCFGSILQMNGSRADNWGMGTDIWAGDIHYDATWQYQWPIPRIKGLVLQAGGGFGATLGGIYSTRGGNNPANAHAQIRLLAALGADYRFRLWKRHWHLGYHLDAPLIGLMFSPQYGQSYYEIFDRHNYDHNAVFTYPGNCATLRQHLFLDIPVCRHGRTLLRLGYLSDIRQAKPNHLQQHQIGRAFMIGVVKSLRTGSDRSALK